MHTVDIKVFCIAQTRLNPAATREWLDHVGAKEYEVPRTQGYIDGNQLGEIEAKGPEVTDAGAVCGLCAKRCYMSFEPGLNPNVTRVRKVWHEYLANILKSGHGSVTEHASWTFAIEGVSRVFTGEMNRHRAGVAVSEGSMRYIRFDDIGFWMPSSLEEGNEILWSKKLGMTKDEFEKKKLFTRNHFKQGFQRMEDTYRLLVRAWGIEIFDEEKQEWVNNPNFSFSVKKKLTSMFRRLVGMGVATGGTWTMNTRALRHIIALRTSPHAEEEIALVMSMIGKYMIENEPALFCDFERDEKTGAWIPKHAKV
jgi:thymidylate synthase (FAD)